MEKNVDTLTNSSSTNAITSRAFEAIKQQNLVVLEDLITESMKSVSSEFKSDIIEFNKPTSQDSKHPYNLDVLASAIYYSEGENIDAFDKLLAYAKNILIDENTYQNLIDDAFWVAALYGKAEIIERLILEKPKLKNLKRWYIPETVQKPEQKPVAPKIVPRRIGFYDDQPRRGLMRPGKVSPPTYQVNCDALQIAIIAKHDNVVEELLHCNFSCQNDGINLCPGTTLMGNDNNITALDLARNMQNKDLEKILLRAINLENARIAFNNQDYEHSKSSFELACVLDPSNTDNTYSSEPKDWLDNLSFIVEYLKTQVENAKEQNDKTNGDSRDYRFVLNFIENFVELFSVSHNSSFKLLYEEFLKNVVERLYAYDCLSNNTPFKLFDSIQAKEAFFNKHSFFSEVSFGKTHSEMQGTYSVNTNIGYFTPAAQNNPQPNNNANYSVINVQTSANKTL